MYSVLRVSEQYLYRVNSTYELKKKKKKKIIFLLNSKYISEYILMYKINTMFLLMFF